MKKIISCLMSAIIVASALSMPVGVCANNKITETLATKIETENAELYPVWIWLDDNDTPETAGNLEKLEKYYTEKKDKFIKDSGISKENVLFISKYTSAIIAKLTPEQIETIAESDEVETIDFYDENVEIETATDGMTKEEFLQLAVSDSEYFSDGGFIYRGDLKFDAVPVGDNKYNLIVYGIKEKDYEKNIRVKNGVLKFSPDYMAGSPVAFYSGITMSVKGYNDNAAIKDGFTAIFYVENVLPGFPELHNLVDASLNCDYDITKYIYSEITAGDTDNDGMLTASDASEVLAAYSYLSTGANITLNKTIFDYNNDGVIDANDASDILQKYAENSTK